MTRSRALSAIVAIAAAAGGCAPAGHAAPRDPAAKPRPVEPVLPRSELGDTGWAEVESRRQSLVVPLPARGSWQVDDREPWFLARHAGTDSELRLRAWIAPRLVRAEECQAQARLWRPSIPPVHEESVVRRRLRAPHDFFGEVVVGVGPSGKGLEGHALAFGASVGRCFAAVFTTRASGPGSEDALGRRLALIVEGVLSRVRLRGVEDRADAARESR